MISDGLYLLMEFLNCSRAILGRESRGKGREKGGGGRNKEEQGGRERARERGG